MKLKNFNDYLKTRLESKEIIKIKKQAKVEFQSLKNLQKDIALAIVEYKTKENISFNELVRRLGTSATQLEKIRKGEANLTLSSLAHISALLNKQPHIVFKQSNNQSFRE